MKKLIAVLLSLGILAPGCSSPEKPVAKPGEKSADASKPIRRATLYVETKGEPVNAGGKKVETADASGSPTGGFSPKDLLLPGMTLLITGATVAGGALIVEALDKKDKPDGVRYVGVSEDAETFASAELPRATEPAGTTPGSDSSTPPPLTPVDPSGVTAVASPRGAEGAASGLSVVMTTPTSVLLMMGMGAAAWTGPTSVKVTVDEAGSAKVAEETWYFFAFTLSVNRDTVKRGETVEVFVTFPGLPEGVPVNFQLVVPQGGEFTVDHPGLIRRVPDVTKGEPIGTLWHYRLTVTSSGVPRHDFWLRSTGGSADYRLGTLKVNADFFLYMEGLTAR